MERVQLLAYSLGNIGISPVSHWGSTPNQMMSTVIQFKVTASLV